MLKKSRNFITGLFSLCDLKKPFDPERFVKEAHGIIPGGMYAGITTIPGDPELPWEEAEGNLSISDLYGSCPACPSGTLKALYQKIEWDDPVIDAYYKIKCAECGYLHDTGARLKKGAIIDTAKTATIKT